MAVSSPAAVAFRVLMALDESKDKSVFVYGVTKFEASQIAQYITPHNGGKIFRSIYADVPGWGPQLLGIEAFQDFGDLNAVQLLLDPKLDVIFCNPETGQVTNNHTGRQTVVFNYNDDRALTYAAFVIKQFCNNYPHSGFASEACIRNVSSSWD